MGGLETLLRDLEYQENPLKIHVTKAVLNPWQMKNIMENNSVTFHEKGQTLPAERQQEGKLRIKTLSTSLQNPGQNIQHCKQRLNHKE